MDNWQKKKLTLKPDHAWRTKPGYAAMVLDQGAVRIDYPDKWIVKFEGGSVNAHEQEPPADDAVLKVSVLRLPMLEDFSVISVAEMVRMMTNIDEREIVGRGEIVTHDRGDVDWAWQALTYVDPDTKRHVVSRMCIARGMKLHALITFDYWADLEKRFEAVWEEALRSLVLEQYVVDPTKGPVRQ